MLSSVELVDLVYMLLFLLLFLSHFNWNLENAQSQGYFELLRHPLRCLFLLDARAFHLDMYRN